MKRIVTLLSLLILTSGCVSIPTSELTPLEERVIGGSGKDKILVIDITGIITDKKKGKKGILGPDRSVRLTSRVREELDKATKDDDLKALIVRINSPGGGVTTSDIIHHEINEFKRKKGIPVIVELMEIATSGGYYIATAGDKIFAHPTTITGSIGVVGVKVDASGLLNKIGIVDETIVSGESKDMLSPLRSMSGEERGIIQSIIDELYGRFVSVISDSRGITEGEIRAFADGRAYTASEALRLNLIDGISYMDGTVEAAKKAAGISTGRIISYSRSGDYRANYYSGTSISAPTTFNLINIDGDTLTDPSMRFMYMWMP